MKEKERDIIEKVKQGDVEAFGQIVTLYSQRIFTLIARVCNNREDAEELTQDTFVKAFGSIAKFRTDSSLSTWLYRIAYNTAISHLRKKRVTVEYEENMTRLEVHNSWDDAGSDVLQERVNTLEQALSLLRADERIVVLLFYKDNKSLKEIAAVLSVTEGNAKTRLHRVRQKLAALFNNLEQG